MLHDIRNAGILPYADHTFADVRVQRSVWIWVNLVFQEVVRVIVVLGVAGVYLKLSHCSYEGFSAVENVLVDGEAVEGQFVFGVSILMDDFHLLYDRRLATFSGA